MGDKAGNSSDNGKFKIIVPSREKIENLFFNLRRLNRGQKVIVMHACF